MLTLLALHLGAAVTAPVLVRWCGRRAFFALALAPAAAFGWAVAQTGTVAGGGVLVERYPWAPRLALDLALRVSTLSWLMVLLIGGVGALVLVYCARYFPADEPGLGRFAGLLVGFAGAMFGLVVADNLLLLYVFWELTTVLSYLLIGHNPERLASRRAAGQALLVTTLGGLAMLIGFIMLGQHAGTFRWSEIMSRPPPATGQLAVALLLILLGALAKSAIFPFSFWLPAAMAAPTPVSAYLHAAAMVKAGVYLVALLAPQYASAVPWRPVLLVAGAVTMLAGGWAALRQVDLKLLLAWGTVSQLGLLLLVLGTGDQDAALAGTAMLLAHALFKGALFLVVGIVDRRAGTRDLTVLTGLWRRMPLVCAVAVLAAASMLGLPPTIGFVAKEAVYTAFGHQPPLLAVLVVGAALTTAYTARLVWGAFGDRPGATPTPTRPVPAAQLGPAALLAVAGLVLGVAAGAIDPVLTPYPALFGSSDHHLALWHGAGLPLVLSALSVVGGGLLFALRDRVQPAVVRLRVPTDGNTVYRWTVRGLDWLAIWVTAATQRGSLPFYLGVILLVLVVAPGGALLAGFTLADQAVVAPDPLRLATGVVLVVVALLTVRARRRLTAVILAGSTGYGSALLFVLHGAPDLALTQFLVETVTIVIFALVLRRLPDRFSVRPLRSSRWLRVALGTAVGVVGAGLVVTATSARRAEPVSAGFPELASSAGGHNLVDVLLVDLRAWDTLGEISLLVVAATGVASLIFQRHRGGRAPRRRELPSPEPGRDRIWLRAGPTLRGPLRSIVLEVVVRLIFHTIVMFSIFLLFAGHNAPGGGFTGGLVAGLALAVRYLAGGRHELDEAAPVDAGRVLGAGLLVTAVTALVPLTLGEPVLSSAIVNLWLPLVGELHLVTSFFFDAGVYLVVVGLALDLLRSLGAEVDRQIEVEEEPGTGLRTEPPAGDGGAEVAR